MKARPALIAAALVASSCSVGQVPETAASVVTTEAPASTTTSEVAPIDPQMVLAAEALCPVLWEWAKKVGGAFNDASLGMKDLEDGAARSQRWLEALDEMEELDRSLLTDTGSIPIDERAEPIRAAISAGVTDSIAEIDDLRELIETTPEIDEQRHQVRTSQLIVRIEKVIDVVKPALAELDADGSMVPAFTSVPSCQHAVKDANDGVPRANG